MILAQMLTIYYNIILYIKNVFYSGKIIEGNIILRNETKIYFKSEIKEHL